MIEDYAVQIPWWFVALVVVGVVCAIAAAKLWGGSSQ